jgi:hypothetical protein
VAFLFAPKIGAILHFTPILTLTLVGFEGETVTDESTVAVDIFDAGSSGPEILLHLSSEKQHTKSCKLLHLFAGK